MLKFTFSRHCYEDRNARIMWIMERVGIGEIDRYFYTPEHRYALTDTGVVLVMDKTDDYVITIHLADEKMLHWMFCGHIPQKYWRIVKVFQKKKFYEIQKKY